MEIEPTAASLYAAFEAGVPPGLAVPDAIRELFRFIGEKGIVAEAGIEGIKAWLCKAERIPTFPEGEDFVYGTPVEFFVQGPRWYSSWFGSSNPEIRRRLFVFSKTGAEGSRAGLWFNDANEPKIVHLGSGSGSTWVGQIGEHPVDFLRLIAIGYDELCWDEKFSEPPRPDPEFPVKPDLEFREWVATTFGVTIPETGAEIVPHRDHMDDDSPRDPFARWVNSMVG
jgi:hypothetical protein